MLDEIIKKFLKNFMHILRPEHKYKLTSILLHINTVQNLTLYPRDEKIDVVKFKILKNELDKMGSEHAIDEQNIQDEMDSEHVIDETNMENEAMQIMLLYM